MKRLKIATVYRDDDYSEYPTHNMAMIRWLRISQGLARWVGEVDMIANVETPPSSLGAGVQIIGFPEVRWEDYDVIKALYQRGFATLTRHGGAEHPFIISSLATVVGKRDGESGVNITPEDRAALWFEQTRIASLSRGVSVRTSGNQALWMREFPDSEPPMVVETGVEKSLPASHGNPYGGVERPVALYTGNLQRGIPAQLNKRWARRLNELGAALNARGVRLCFLGPSEGVHLDPAGVAVFDPVSYDESWDFKRFARVGIALAEGPAQLNESSKIYQYLRAGLPVVSEEPIPNNTLLEETGMGLVVPYDDLRTLADGIEAVIHSAWPGEAAGEYLAKNHSWDRRAKKYADWLGEDPGERLLLSAIPDKDRHCPA